MIFNNNSTRGHTGSLLVCYYCYCCVVVATAADADDDAAAAVAVAAAAAALYPDTQSFGPNVMQINSYTFSLLKKKCCHVSKNPYTPV